MAFGVLTTTCLLAFGVPPAQASAMTHATEVFTTAASGLSHAYHKNVDWRLVARLAPAGVVGAVIGATILSNVDGEAIMPFVSAYLMAIGVYIAFKAWRPAWPREFRDWIVPLVGFGGGGWGPVVTSSLLGRGHNARTVIGSTNLTEFMVTVATSVTFIITLGWSELQSAIGLIIGGVLAAPVGGFMVAKIPVRPLMFAVAAVVIVTSAIRFF